MKGTIFIILLLTFNSAFSQEVAIELERENILINGITNPINVVVENTDCESIYLTCKDALIENNGCKKYIQPKTNKKVLTISISKIHQNDTIFIKDKLFRVKELPNPIANFRGHSGGNIEVEHFKRFSAKSFSAYSDFVCIRFKITSFKLVVIKSDQSTFMSENFNSELSIKSKELIKNIEVGDTIHFLDIKCKIQDEERELNSIKFQII